MRPEKAEECTIYRTADLISRRWTLLILFELYKGNDFSLRFSELKRNLRSITSKVLSQRLKELENEGLVERWIDDTVIPVRTTYALTEPGVAFFKVIQAFKDWALRWRIDNKVCAMTVCRHCTARVLR